MVATLLSILTILAPPYFDPAAITCLYITDDGTLTAVAQRHEFQQWISADGGLAWEYVDRQETVPEQCSDMDAEQRSPWVFFDPNDRSVVYHFVPGEQIERSEDGGETWRVEYTLGLTNAQITYLEFVKQFWFIGDGPFDAVLDPDTGNLVLAMGQTGVLIREPDGNWVRASVGYFEYPALGFDYEQVFTLLSGEIGIAVSIFFLLPYWFGLAPRPGGCFPKGFVITITLLLIFWILDMPATNAMSYTWHELGPLIWGIVLLGSMGVFLWMLLWFSEIRTPAGKFFGASFLSACLYFVPFLLWVFNILPNYEAGLLLAMALNFAFLIWAFSTFRVETPLEPEAEPAE